MGFAPVWFDYTVHWVLNSGVQVGRSRRASDLTYTDDITIFGSSCEAVQQTLIHDKQTLAVGLRANTSKTMAIRSVLAAEDVGSITPEGVTLERVDSFKYLGTLVTNSGQRACAIESCERPSAVGTLVYGVAKKPRSVRIYRAVVSAIQLYG